jgi:hypothetical protein
MKLTAKEWQARYPNATIYDAKGDKVIVSAEKVLILNEDGSEVWKGSQKQAFLALVKMIRESDDLRMQLAHATGDDREMMGS